MFISEDEIYKTLGENIQKARNKANISQEELAKSVKLVRTSITNIEKGKQKIQIHTLYQIAFALSVSIDDLLPELNTIAPDVHQLLNQQSLEQDTKEAVLRVLGKH